MHPADKDSPVECFFWVYDSFFALASTVLPFRMASTVNARRRDSQFERRAGEPGVREAADMKERGTSGCKVGVGVS